MWQGRYKDVIFALILKKTIRLLLHWKWFVSVNSLRPSGVSKLPTIGLDNGLLPGQRQAIIWTNAGILLIGPLRTNFSEILIEIPIFSFKKMHLKESSAKWQPCCLGLSVLTHSKQSDTYVSVNKAIIGSDNGLLPVRFQAVIWTMMDYF